MERCSSGDTGAIGAFEKRMEVIWLMFLKDPAGYCIENRR